MNFLKENTSQQNIDRQARRDKKAHLPKYEKLNPLTNSATSSKMSEDRKQQEIKCRECNKTFSSRSNLMRHLRSVHQYNEPRADYLPGDLDAYNYKCLEGCNLSYRYNTELRHHLQNKHGLEMIEMPLEFPNTEEFMKWLRQEEANNCVQYPKPSATKKRLGGTQTFYYECSRTGLSRGGKTTEDTSNKDDTTTKRRKPRTVHKLDRACTSQIIVNKIFDGSLDVTYHKTHYGHEIDPQHLRIPTHERGAIASKLLLGIPVSDVLNSVKNSDNTATKRIGLLKRKDLNNIKRSFNLTKKDGGAMSSSADTINLQSFLEECQQQQFNPVEYYSPTDVHTFDSPTSDTIYLIILSRFQSEVLTECSDNNTILVATVTLNNCAFEATILFVVYENGESFPAACMFSNHNAPHVFEFFFRHVKEKVGRLTPSVLMTNADDVHYKAWVAVMDHRPEHLYNPTHVDVMWTLHLNHIRHVNPDVVKAKRRYVYSRLMLLQTVNNKRKFSRNFDRLCDLLRSDVDCRGFMENFSVNFDDPKKWANCHRLDYKVDQDCVDGIMSELKRYLNAETEKRFDKIFHSLIRYVRDETVGCLMKTNAPQMFVSDNNARHHMTTCKNYEIAAVANNKNIWNVIDEQTTYVVQRHLLTNCCDLICSTCQVCLHCFSCTCVDYFVSNAICDHIHQVLLTHEDLLRDVLNPESAVSDQTRDANEDDDRSEVETEDDDLLNEDLIVAQREENVQNLKRQIEYKLAYINETFKKVKSEQVLSLIVEHMTKAQEVIGETMDDDPPDLKPEPDHKESAADPYHTLIDHCYF